MKFYNVLWIYAIIALGRLVLLRACKEKREEVRHVPPQEDNWFSCGGESGT